MQTEYSQDIYKKIISKAKLYAKLSKVKKISKISGLDYDKFIEEIEQAKEVYPKNKNFFDSIQKIAYECKMIHKTEETLKSQYAPEILSLACYKVLENEIKKGKIFERICPLYYGVNAGLLMGLYDGPDYAISLLKKCVIASKKEQDLEM